MPADVFELQKAHPDFGFAFTWVKVTEWCSECGVYHRKLYIVASARHKSGDCTFILAGDDIEFVWTCLCSKLKFSKEYMP